MTIDSSWIACFKEEAPAAFTSLPPFAPNAVFCDGQIKLMCPAVGGFFTWADYIHRQFARGLQQYLDKGVECVILAFDDYSHVPSAKHMTQANRRRNVGVFVFQPRDPLPPLVPQGDKWNQCISNRVFKGKLIQLVIERLACTLALAEGQSLIVDYQGHPVRYLKGGVSETLGCLAPLGEADVKFTRYASMFDRLQVDSVDGDSLPIALLHMEAGGKGQISILRLETRVKDAPPAKRARPDARPKRVYEYVDVRRVYEALCHELVPHCLPRPAAVAHRGHEIAMLVSLIGLSGTDFTRGLPLVSGRTLYDSLPSLWQPLECAYDPESRQLRPDQALEHLVAHIYHLKFQRHASAGGLDAVLKALAASKLGERTRTRLPTRPVLHCTVRNVNWLLCYWQDPVYPDPIQPRFGYARVKGAVCFDA